ncbi:hypothetical protein PGT21_033353 [Puccinia graminis f. sp. tritici]|nr:hypothetical protein PGT21_033353 [Puccinia graminis f. sp. tritici]
MPVNVHLKTKGSISIKPWRVEMELAHSWALLDLPLTQQWQRIVGARGVSGDETSERRPAESELHPGPGTEPEESLPDERGTSLQMPKNKLGPQAQLGWLD